jgi:hypothetical protein
MFLLYVPLMPNPLWLAGPLPVWHYSATRKGHRSSMISGEDSWREVRKGEFRRG